ncbi:GNAT family N-acetyltransferase [Fusobacterium mortiferum]|uniref:GNAT family N-acetyltransferase n=1 Tax=Fusobacterium mortiferum TaxID=850 RepID=UPI0001A2AC4A|nr:GNAT family N-acetyltransferase [Fusobacterium mortiferum]EEO36148.1 hypothetical protein FMAG_01710 [Fusobacterium mortiferum ATCC 9817]
MSYILKEVVLRTNNTPEGMEKISQLWGDILSKKISLLPENKNELLISKYSNYESDENGEYDLTIMRRELKFLLKLDERVKNREFIKYEEIDDNIENCARKVWNRVWEDKKNNKLNRVYIEDYQLDILPIFSQDGKCHSILYISVKEENTIKIRKYKSSDCQEITELFYNTVHSINKKDYTQEQLDVWATKNIDIEKWDTSFLKNYTVVAESNGIIVGFGDIAEDGYLDRLYVHKAFQRIGIATMICDKLENKVKGKPLYTHYILTPL